MQVFGDMSLGALAQFASESASGEETANFSARVLDSDGDGRSDLFLMDADGDGKVDGAVRGLDVNGDGENDTYVAYNEDGSVRSIGRVAENGELEVVWEEPSALEAILADLGLVDLEPPEAALFTSFDDPYIGETYGEYGADLPDDLPDTFVALPSDIEEIGDAEFQDLTGSGTVVDGAVEPSETDDGTEAPGQPDAAGDAPAVADGDQEPQEEGLEILHVEDAGDGWLRAEVDTNADGVADRTEDLARTVDGWEADVDRDGLKETVAFDVDRDGRVDSVDTSGTGDWAGAEQAWETVEPTELVDEALFEPEPTDVVDATADAGIDTSPDLDAGYDAGAGLDTSSSLDTSDTSVADTTSVDVGASVDVGGDDSV